MNGKVVAIVILVMALGGFLLILSKNSNRQSTGVKVKLPALSALAQTGRTIFQTNCARCHGLNAGGTSWGPPLIHKFYQPSRFADGAFYKAAANGVRSHNWRFGSMPPIRSVNQQDVSKIITFIREVQKANGLF